MLMDVARFGGAEKLEVFMQQTAALRDCEAVNAAHLRTILAAMIENKIAPNAIGAVASDFASMTNADAAAIGGAFARILLTVGNPTQAVAQYVSEYPALKAVEDEHPWFRPMLVTIAVRLLRSSPYGLRMRVGIGAVLSFADIASDIWMIVSLFVAGSVGSSSAIFAAILLSVVLQSIIVIVQHKHRGARTLALELLIVWSFMKPAIDAYRVATGQEKVKGCVLDPNVEMMAGKILEMA